MPRQVTCPTCVAASLLSQLLAPIVVASRLGALGAWKGGHDTPAIRVVCAPELDTVCRSLQADSDEGGDRHQVAENHRGSGWWR